MADENHLKILGQGVKAWNRWREKNRLTIPDLRRVHLPKALLRGAHLEGAYMEMAKLEGANLVGAHLDGAHLDGTNLHKANLDGAHLEGACLTGAKLTMKQIESGRFGLDEDNPSRVFPLVRGNLADFSENYFLSLAKDLSSDTGPRVEGILTVILKYINEQNRLTRKKLRDGKEFELVKFASDLRVAAEKLIETADQIIRQLTQPNIAPAPKTEPRSKKARTQVKPRPKRLD